MNEETRKNGEIHTNEKIPENKKSVVDEEVAVSIRVSDSEEKTSSEEGQSADTGKKKGKKKDKKKDKKGKEKGEGKGKGKKKGRVSASTVILVIILLAGLMIFLYPSISNWWNSMHATQAIASYVAAVEDLSAVEKEEMLEQARAFNESLPNGVNFELSEEKLAEYESILNIGDTGVMGYVQISEIGVNLPIYHTVDEEILQIAVGHIPGSSFPVGGVRTHAVMSGHRGLPSAKLFSDLDKMKEGDIFTVTILDETVTYMVDQIRIVLPEETDDLAIEEGKDYCTLVTCTPYGVNSHRILMRGHRIANLDGIVLPAEALRIPTYIVIPAVGIPILFVVLSGMLIHYRRRGPKRSTQEVLNELKKPGSGKSESKK